MLFRSVTINNKYGSVVVSTWEKDSVKISVTRSISEKTPDRLKRLAENIDFRFREGQGLIVGETVFGSKHATFIQNVKEAGNISTAGPRTKIDYNITIPAYVHLDITNKYGDVVLPALTGHVKVDLSNGNIQSRDLSGLAEMTLAFGNAEFRNIRQGNIFLNFVNFTCDNSELLTIDGRSSEIRIKDVDHLKISSRRDRINLSNARVFEVDAYFSNISCLNLESYGNLKLTYGRLEQLNLSANFKSCDIISQTCDVNLKLIKPVDYSALIKANKAIIIPADLKPEDPSLLKMVTSQPVRFIFRKKTMVDKIKINITDGDLKIEHQ